LKYIQLLFHQEAIVIEVNTEGKILQILVVFVYYN